MYKATINVTLKKSVLDPQGKTVLHALGTLGFEEAKDIRVGKFFEVTLDAASPEKAESRIRDMCDRLLTNPVIEDYSFDLKKS
ncbi:MAG: phosphoribosylformylglycinamidine synthase subunit PurS [Candidatus Omnitrophota bacterium]|nr:phosphoribosylformylglycinamidine synthase subunit PurS [Candidatus Omnitrophota bacterium]